MWFSAAESCDTHISKGDWGNFARNRAKEGKFVRKDAIVRRTGRTVTTIIQTAVPTNCNLFAGRGTMTMTPSTVLFQLAIVLAIVTASHQKDPASAQEKPLNFVILFADNLGYDDVSCFQSTEKAAEQSAPSTPHIDHMAEQGMKFTNWNSAAALCSASRAALLTGKYPVRTGTYPRTFRNDATFGLLPDETTLAELLKVEEYATSIV